MATVFVSIGSNIDKEENIPSSIAMLKEHFALQKLSSVYRSEAYGFVGDDFLNMVVSLETELSPREVADHLQEIERKHGRVKGENSMVSREIDLDQILYDQLVCDEEGLQLPSNDIERPFVIIPLAEIAGDLSHPVSKVRFADICTASGERLEKVALDIA